jgi:hypothetical protein
MTASIGQRFAVCSVETMGDGDAEEVRLLGAMLVEAERWLRQFRWCCGVRRRYFGLGIGAVVAVFLFEIENAASPDDQLLWVIVGDLPPAYLVVDEARNAHQALSAYVALMREWVEAAGAGRPVGDLVPVNVAATPANAFMLAQRLDLLERDVLGTDGC